MKVIACLLGIPGEDYATFKRWSNAFLSTVSDDRNERIQNIQDMIYPQVLNRGGKGMTSPSDRL